MRAGRGRSIEPRHGRSSRTASGWPRSGRWRRGWRTSSTTRPPPRGGAAAQLAEALDVIGSALGAVRRVGHRARGGGSSWWRCSSRRARACAAATALDALDAADAEDELLGAPRRRWASRSHGGWPSRSPRRASTRRGWSRVARAGGPGDARGAALGRRDADRRAARRRAAASPPSGCLRSSAP